MNRYRIETLVGLFVVLGIACLAWLSIRLGRSEVVGSRGYVVRAAFGSVAGLSTGAPVEIAGVQVGRVTRLGLSDYRAIVTMRIDPHVELPDDSIASIKTRGLVGDKFIQVTPGASRRVIPPGATLLDTEDAIDIEELISQFIHGKI